MSKIPLSEGGGFTLLPEGTYIFKIESVKHNEDFGSLVLKLVTEKGQKMTKKFSYLTRDGEVVEGALNMMSWLARSAMNDNTLKDIDPEALVGRFFSCELTHDVRDSRNKPDETVTFMTIGGFAPADGWETPAAKQRKKVDLSGLL